MDRTAVGAVSGDVRRDRRGGASAAAFFRRFRSGGCGDVSNLRAGEACAQALRRK